MKMKKFMNAPETVTDEELVGLGLAYPDILNVDGHLVISKDLADADRVTIVTYGGSGHEPAQAAAQGAEATKEFVSKFGRAKSYGTKTIGTPDAGAVSMSCFFQGLARE